MGTPITGVVIDGKGPSHPFGNKERTFMPSSLVSPKSSQSWCLHGTMGVMADASVTVTCDALRFNSLSVKPLKTSPCLSCPIQPLPPFTGSNDLQGSLGDIFSVLTLFPAFDNAKYFFLLEMLSPKLLNLSGALALSSVCKRSKQAE